MRTIWKLIDWSMALLLAVMIALVFTNVVLRYGFDSGLRFSVELSRLFFVWVVMLGAVTCLRRGEHLAVTEFSEVFMPRAVPVLRRLIWLVIIVCAIMLLVGSWRQTVANWSNISQLTGLPKGLFYLAGVVSGAMMSALGIKRLFSVSQQQE